MLGADEAAGMPDLRTMSGAPEPSEHHAPLARAAMIMFSSGALLILIAVVIAIVAL